MPRSRYGQAPTELSVLDPNIVLTDIRHALIRGTGFDHALSGVPSIVDFMTPDAWSAFAHWALVVIALVAAGAAFWQVREARSCVLSRPSHTSWPTWNRIAATRGSSSSCFATSARQRPSTSAVSDPLCGDPRRVEATRTSQCSTYFPSWCPAKSGELCGTSARSVTSRPGLTDRYDVSVAYKDSRGKRLSTNSLLDWGPYKRRAWLSTYDTHEVALALRPDGNIGRSLRGIDRDLTRIAESLSLGDGCCTPGARGAGGDGDGDGG